MTSQAEQSTSSANASGSMGSDDKQSDGGWMGEMAERMDKFEYMLKVKFVSFGNRIKMLEEWKQDMEQKLEQKQDKT